MLPSYWLKTDFAQNEMLNKNQSTLGESKNGVAFIFCKASLWNLDIT